MLSYMGWASTRHIVPYWSEQKRLRWIQSGQCGWLGMVQQAGFAVLTLGLFAQRTQMDVQSAQTFIKGVPLGRILRRDQPVI